MKYSENNKPIVCLQTNSTCYLRTNPMKEVKGVLFHSTGANNKNLKRYVQPLSTDNNYEKMIHMLGTNKYGNDMNHKVYQMGVNAWIGETASGEVITIQALPWDFRPWGCGQGKKGSCNDGWIQFEICEDSLKDKEYFDKIYEESCQLTAYLCKKYGLNPKGKVLKNGVEIPVITCHVEANNLGFASNHGDILHWFNKYGKSMEDIRNYVAELMDYEDKKEIIENFAIGERIYLQKNATYYDGKKIPAWVHLLPLYYRGKSNNNAIISTQKTGAITGMVDFNNITKKFNPYKIKTKVQKLNIRQKPNDISPVVGIADMGVYTIIQKKKNWGLLKSGAGWINLNYTEEWGK